MEKKNVPNESMGIEKMVQSIFVLYALFICITSILLDRYLYCAVITVILCAMCIIFRVRNAMDYKTRALVTTAMIQLSIFLFSMQMKDINVVIPILMTSIVVVQLYGIPEVMHVVFIGVVVSIGYHGLVMHSIVLDDRADWVHAVFMVINVLLSIMLTFLLLTKRKKSTESISRIISDLKEAEHGKDEFLANVSHELRTPLNTICGMSDVSLKEKDINVIYDNLYRIQIAGRNLISVVSDILDYSELRNGQVVLEEENYYISSTINDVVNTVMAKSQDKKIEIIVDCNPQLPSILYGDEKKIRRVIMNLVNNAIKFTQEGCIGIEITFRKESYGINLIINVRDTGIGMTQESIEKIFKDFSQADGTTRRQQSGLGLGLAISNAMVRKMGGIITVRSTYGKGTSMRVTIPQKVIDEAPIANVNKPERINAALYLNMEKYRLMQTRDEYTRLIDHILRGLQVKNHICRNLQELKRRVKNEGFSHIFISYGEYTEDTEYFDEVAKDVHVVILVDESEIRQITNNNLYQIPKPFYVLPVVGALNNVGEAQQGNASRTERFVAPEAHILVVDDNEMNLMVIERILKAYKVQVTKANSGREALDTITSKDFDFVFMDHMMPEMDGIETLKRIREKQDNYYQKVPIIALTANAVAGAREMFLSEGFADFIEKPVEISVLERVLRRNLPDSKIVEVSSLEEKEEHSDSKKQGTAAVQSDGKVVDSTANGIVAGGNLRGNDLEQAQVSKTSTENGPKDDNPLDFLNTEMGMTYCGGEESYYEILANCHKSYNKTLIQLQEAFEQKNWKDYVVYIHALKSTMKTIGAEEVSEYARKLEMAGKEERYNVIEERHAMVMEEYGKIIHRLEAVPFLDIEVAEKNADNLEGLVPLTEEDKNRLLQEFEEAVFNFDEGGMKGIVENLMRFHYKEIALSSRMNSVVEKVDKSDYMSALEDLNKLFENIQRERGDK